MGFEGRQNSFSSILTWDSPVTTRPGPHPHLHHVPHSGFRPPTQRKNSYVFNQASPWQQLTLFSLVLYFSCHHPSEIISILNLCDPLPCSLLAMYQHELRTSICLMCKYKALKHTHTHCSEDHTVETLVTLKYKKENKLISSIRCLLWRRKAIFLDHGWKNAIL